MRMSTKKTIIGVLVAAQLLTMTGCGDKGPSSPPDREVMASVAQEEIELTQEFSSTSTSSWVDSNFKKYWYQEDKDAYAAVLSGLEMVRAENGFNIYSDGDKEVTVQGMDVVDFEGLPEYQEEYGLKLRFVTSEEERISILTQDYKSGVWVNGNQITDVSFSDVYAEKDGIDMVNLSMIAQAAGIDVKAYDQSATISTHAMESCDQPQNIELEIGQVAEVIDSENGNMYYSLFQEENDDQVFATVEVVQNFLGWDIYVNSDAKNMVVWVDDIYRPAESSVIVISQTAPDKVEESVAPPVVAPEVSKPAEPVSKPAEPTKPSESESSKPSKEPTQSSNAGTPAGKDTLGLGIEMSGKSPAQKDYLNMSAENQKMYLESIMEFMELSEAEAKKFLAESLADTEFIYQGDIGTTGGPPSSLWG